MSIPWQANVKRARKRVCGKEQVEIFDKNGNVHLVDVRSFRVCLMMSDHLNFKRAAFRIKHVLYSLS